MKRNLTLLIVLVMLATSSVAEAGAWQGYINRSGKPVLTIPQGLIGGYEFHDGLARVSSSDGGTGFIDRSGTTVVSTQRVLAGDFSEGLARSATSRTLDLLAGI